MSNNPSTPASSLAKHRITFSHLILALALFFMLFLSGCATVGRDFPTYQVPRIKIGETTQTDIRSMFGPPWRVGVEDGTKTWTYGKYRYGLLTDSSTQDLVVRFNDNGIVTSYTYNTTEPPR
ncbi:MAG: outer membrane protein assembly factor BamE [Proteobacteria bacterium]|nr:outer membrane protein assembly factor BamE [Pseudomonadota bacterium]MBU0965890.1 outer membrane protein assembly factor BamE [Pseudomonadota bacterium]